MTWVAMDACTTEEWAGMYELEDLPPEDPRESYCWHQLTLRIDGTCLYELHTGVSQGATSDRCDGKWCLAGSTIKAEWSGSCGLTDPPAQWTCDMLRSMQVTTPFCVGTRVRSLRDIKYRHARCDLVQKGAVGTVRTDALWSLDLKLGKLGIVWDDYPLTQMEKTGYRIFPWEVQIVEGTVKSAIPAPITTRGIGKLRRPTKEDEVLILSNDYTQENIPAMIGKIAKITEDCGGPFPYKVEGETDHFFRQEDAQFEETVLSLQDKVFAVRYFWTDSLKKVCISKGTKGVVVRIYHDATVGIEWDDVSDEHWLFKANFDNVEVIKKS